MISVKNLWKRYGTLMAVRDVSFEVQKGDIVGLLGHNGAGKSTVMKIMTGYIEATEGTVSVGGKDVHTDRISAQQLIGYMPESAPLYGEMLVQEYLLMMADLRGIPASERKSAVVRAVKATGLSERLVQAIGTLSKGYRQRVALAQAILHQPPVLVLDEPTSGLDPVQILEIRHLIRALAETSTVIISTHILSEIEAVCNRTLIMIGGQLAADSTLNELRASNVVRLSVNAKASGVPDKLVKVPGVASVRRRGPDPDTDGFDIWTLECNSATDRPTPKIIETCVEAGWTLASARAETPSLETVFRDLMEQNAKSVLLAAQTEAV